MLRQSTIESFVIESVKQEPVPSEIYGFESLPVLARTILENCPVVIINDDYDEQQQVLNLDGNLDEDPAFTLSQASIDHKRSFIVHGEGADRSWEDEFGNSYGCLTLKGNNFTHTDLIETSTAHDRFIAYGLQESAIIERVLVASRLLRESGISTEYIVGLAEPRQYLVRHNGMANSSQSRVTLPEYKQTLADTYWEKLDLEQKTPEQLLEIFEKQKASTYYISLRAMDTPYRISDMYSPSIRQEVFDTYHELHPDSDTLDAENNVDWNTYNNEHLVPTLAKNFALLHHKLKLAHRFPNKLNISALGSIVDLDSVHGETMGLEDEPITYRDIVEDLHLIMRTLQDMSLMTPDGITANYYATSVSFLKEYFKNTMQILPNNEHKRMQVEIVTHLAKYELELLQDYNQDADYDSLNGINYVQAFLSPEIYDEEMIICCFDRWLEENDHILSQSLDSITPEELEPLFDVLAASWIHLNRDDIALSRLDPKKFLRQMVQDQDSFVSQIIFITILEKTTHAIHSLNNISKLETRTSWNIEDIYDDLSPTAIEVIKSYSVPSGSMAFDGWIESQYEKFISICEDNIESIFEFKTDAPLFSDHSTTSIAINKDRNQIRLTPNILFNEIIDTLDIDDSWLVNEFASYKKPNGPLYFKGDPDTILTQIVSDGLVQMDSPVSQYSDYQNFGIVYEAPNSRYVLFREKILGNPEGSQLALQIIDPALIYELPDTLRQQVLRLMERERVHLNSLFEVSSLVPKDLYDSEHVIPLLHGIIIND